MIWEDYRETADRTLELSCTIIHRVTGAEPLLLTERGRASLLRELDAQTAAASARFAALVLESRDALSEVVGYKVPQEHLFPWALLLPSGERDRLIRLLALDSPRRLRLDLDLIGQSYHAGVEMLSFLGQNTGTDQYRSFTLVVAEVEFGEGSFWKKVTATIAFSASAVGLLAFPPIKDQVDLVVFDYKVETMVESQKCTIETSWRFDGDRFRTMSLEALDYGDPSITPEEKRLRMCNAQLALRLAQDSPAKIDGWDGPRTKAALIAYAASKGVEADIRSEVLRGHLFREFHRRTLHR